MTFNGVIPPGWKKVNVKEIANINEMTMKKDFPESHIEYIDISSVNEGNVSEYKIIEVAEAPSRAKRIVKNKDILISTVRPNLKHYVYIKEAKKNTIASTGFAVITAKNIHSRFLYYALTTSQFTEYLTRIADSHTSAYPSFNPDVIENAEILIPPNLEAEKIADFLGALDDKIVNNHQTNNILELIAQTIFKHWFIDFEFPNEGGEPYKSSGGELVLNEELKKNIPKGWYDAKLNDIIEIFDSKRIPISKREREKRKGIYPYYGATSIMDYIDDYIFDGIYVLMGEDGTVIDENDKPILQYVWGKIWVNNHAHVIQGRDGFPTEFIYLLLKNTNIKHVVTGAVQPKVNQTNMKNLIILKPPLKVINNYARLINPIFNLYRNNVDENKILIQLRDLLLPKLIMGKIRVPLEGNS